MFDYGVELEELRRHRTEWLRAERTRVVTEQRRLHVRELAVTRVLDERGALGPLPDATVSARTAKATVDVARELESLPAIAAAAASGSVSWDQLQPLVEIATPDSDREWAARAPGLAPIDLQRIPADVERHVRLRDLHCRTPGCEETHGLQLHHMDPVCRGGGNEVGADMLVMVCCRDHPMYEPHGPWRLVGDPEQPDGLRLVHRDEALAEARAEPSP